MVKSSKIDSESGGTRVYYGSQWLATLVRKYVVKKPDDEDA